MSKKRWIIFFILIISWVLLIFYFSSRDPLTSSQQSSYITKIIKKIDQIIDFSDTKLFQKIEIYLKKLWFKTQYVPPEMLVRKTAHFGLYFILSILTFLTFYTIPRAQLYTSILLGVTLPNLIAVLDEYTQQYYYRGSSLNDVIIDLSGAITGVIFILTILFIFKLVYKLSQKKNQSK